MLVLILACTGGGSVAVPGDTDEPTIPPTPALTDLALTPSTIVPSVFQVSWTAPGPGTSWVEYGLEGPSGTSSPEVVATTTAHSVRLVGLKAGREYQVKAVTRLDSGTTLETAPATLVVPDGPHAVTLVTSTPEATVPGGYVVTALIEPDGGYAVILDGDGDLVWWYDTGHAGSPPPDMAPFMPPAWDGATMPLSTRLDVAAGDLLVEFTDGDRVLDLGTLRRIPLDAMLDSEMVTTRLPLGHHDFVTDGELGRVGFLAYETEAVGDVVWASDAIVEGAEGDVSADPASRHRVWGWLGDFPAEPSLFDPTQEAFLVQGLADLEWTHGNSLMYDQGAGAYFVMSKYLDAIVKVDRASGDEEWVIGGPYSDFTLPGGGPVWEGLLASALWSHAHMSHLWYDPVTATGGFAVFDNGYNHASQDGLSLGWTRAVEYRFDETARTVEEVWAYAEPGGGFTALMGDVRKLDGGSYLVGWSALNRIEEIGPDEIVRWRVDLPPEVISARVSWYDELPPGRP